MNNHKMISYIQIPSYPWIVLLTKDDGDFLVRFGKWVRDIALGEDDNRSVEGGPEP